MRNPTPSPTLTREPGGVSPLVLAAAASVWIALPANWPLWQALARLPETASLRGALFVAQFALMLALLLLALLAGFAFARSVKPAIAVFALAAAFGAHFMGSYGVVIDSAMLTNVLQTNYGEARDLLSFRLAAGLLLLAGLPLWALWLVPVRRSKFAAQLGRNTLAAAACVLAIAALGLASFAELSATMRNHKSIRFLINPLNSFYALGLLGYQANARPIGPLRAIGADARIAPPAPGTRPPLLVLVIGETARADHFALNGYSRPTNPELARHGVLSFSNVTSCGTSTAASLPCMFSHLGRQGFEARTHDSENVLDVVQRAGMAVLWLDNQAGCKGVCARVANAHAHVAPPGAAPLPKALCSDGECFDEALLHGLDERIAALPAERRARGVLLVLHPMGSHGPAYYKRSPAAAKRFLPECTTNALQQCSKESLINAYDNSIVYADRVLAALIGWLERQSARHDTSLFYVSDHGESLGENNLYLHGLPFAFAPREQTHVPWLAWMSPATQATSDMRSHCLRERSREAIAHDHLFHTVLGHLRIHASEYRPELDAFSPCRMAVAAVVP